jgi:putative ABC transport system permease protein
METLLQDLRYGARMLIKRPGFTVVAMIALALGIGANTAIFSVVNAVLLRPLAYKDPDRLVVVWSNNTREGNARYPVAAANFVDFKEQNHVFDTLAAYLSFTPNMTLAAATEPVQITQSSVSPDLFPLLGVEAALGRTFSAEEAQVGKDQVVILSHGLWQRQFGGDKNILGQTLTLDGVVYTIIGVMPKDFYFLYRNADLWIPLSFNTRFNPNFTITNRAGGALGLIGRLKPDVSIEQARAEMDAIAARLADQYPTVNSGIGVTLVTLDEQMTESVRTALLVLLAAVSFVLLVACANVATLLLARAASRQKEIAIRAALGAGRVRLIRQLLTEAVLLSALGGALGALLAIWGIDLILALSPSEIPRQNEIGIDASVLMFTLGLSVLTGVIFGLVPALQLSKSGLHEALKEGGRSSAGSTRQGVRNVLVISQVALTLVLLVGAGLLIRSFVRLLNVDPGFRTENLLVMNIAVPTSLRGAPPQKVAYYQELFERIEAIPGVESAGAVTRLPLTARGVTTKLSVEGHAVAPGEEPDIEFRRASQDYFSALGVKLIDGRYFNAQDTAQNPGVVIVNQSAARRLWPDETAIDKRVRTTQNPNAPWLTVVGVIGDVKHFGLDADARPEIYISSEQAPPDSPFMVVRTTSDPMNVAASVRAQVGAMNKDQPVNTIQTMEEVLAASVAGRRFNMLLLAMFAGLALLLAAVGIYGVISYSVTQRTQEIGIRMALGAQTRDVLGMVIAQAAKLALAGVAIGLIASFLLTRLMKSLLFNVSATDPVTFLAVSLLLVALAFAASYIPALRATKVDPMIALRYE